MSNKVRLINARLIILDRILQKWSNNVMALLRPKRVGDANFNALALPRAIQLALQFAESRMHLRLVLRKMHDPGHLRFGVAVRAGISHRQASRNAVRREEQI